MKKNHSSLRRNQKGVSPAISTVILTSAVIVMILVVMTYGQGFLNSSMAQNEFNANKQFTQTTGLQIDDIAWTTGRTQTITYSAKYGSLNFTQSALTYKVQVDNNPPVTWHTGLIIFNMPVASYSLGNNYFARVPYTASSSFMLSGSSAPVSQVLCEEKLPMSDGSYARLAVVPTFRVLNSTITENQVSTTYFKFYLPILENATNFYRSQSVTLTGNGIEKQSFSNAHQVTVTVSFPKQSAGFDSSFFNFQQVSQTMILPFNQQNVVEFYVGNVAVAIGLV
jgi:hypothetical protein